MKEHCWLTKFKERARRTGQRSTTPKVASTDDYREAMANACFWLGTAEAAEFHRLDVSVCHLCGGGREVSALKPEDLSVVCVNEDLHSHHAISVTLQRNKDGPLLELSLYPHRHSLQAGPHFGFICSLSVGGCDKSDLFPKISREATVVNKNKKTESRVASFWTLCFDNLHKEFKSLLETVSDKLTCYHGRKGVNQKMAQTNSVSGLAQVFCTGWELRGFHTLFAYVVGSETPTNPASKAPSGWTSQRDNEIIGGHPPELKCIHSSPELANNFVLAPFGGDIEDRWPVSIKNMPTTTLLLHCDEFVHIIEQHPNGL